MFLSMENGEHIGVNNGRGLEQARGSSQGILIMPALSSTDAISVTANSRHTNLKATG